MKEILFTPPQFNTAVTGRRVSPSLFPLRSATQQFLSALITVGENDIHNITDMGVTELPVLK